MRSNAYLRVQAAVSDMEARLIKDWGSPQAQRPRIPSSEESQLSAETTDLFGSSCQHSSTHAFEDGRLAPPAELLRMSSDQDPEDFYDDADSMIADDTPLPVQNAVCGGIGRQSLWDRLQLSLSPEKRILDEVVASSSMQAKADTLCVEHCSLATVARTDPYMHTEIDSKPSPELEQQHGCLAGGESQAVFESAELLGIGEKKQEDLPCIPIDVASQALGVPESARSDNTNIFRRWRSELASESSEWHKSSVGESPLDTSSSHSGEIRKQLQGQDATPRLDPCQFQDQNATPMHMAIDVLEGSRSYNQCLRAEECETESVARSQQKRPASDSPPLARNMMLKLRKFQRELMFPGTPRDNERVAMQCAPENSEDKKHPEVIARPSSLEAPSENVAGHAESACEETVDLARSNFRTTLTPQSNLLHDVVNSWLSKSSSDASQEVTRHRLATAARAMVKTPSLQVESANQWATLARRLCCQRDLIVQSLRCA